jgi:hypothetical protein
MRPVRRVAELGSLDHMTRDAIFRFDRLATRLLFVSLACALLFVVERFAYNVFGIGRGAHQSLFGYLWLVILPWVGYWAVLERSPLGIGWKRWRRTLVFGAVALVLALAFAYCALIVFYEIVWAYNVQFF